jgi:hypothetical protein
VSSPFAAEILSDPEGLVVLASPDGSVTDSGVLELLSSLPCLVVAVDRTPADAPVFADVAPEDGVASIDDILEVATANPVAATSLALLLRGSPPSLGAGLAAESAVYSLLQAGAEFNAWRAGAPLTPHHDDAGDPLRVATQGGALEIVLTRPGVRNALNVAMRDALLDALALAHADPAIIRVTLRGDGPSFCSGGDLNEFGTFVDPASAHTLRLATSVGRALHGLGARLAVEVHGPCAGSGVELAAFSANVGARPDFTAALPEVTLGLIPGAGGTVSIRHRIGRHRTALLALSGATIDAERALRWGLVDEILAG